MGNCCSKSPTRHCARLLRQWNSTADLTPYISHVQREALDWLDFEVYVHPNVVKAVDILWRYSTFPEDLAREVFASYFKGVVQGMKSGYSRTSMQDLFRLQLFNTSDLALYNFVSLSPEYDAIVPFMQQATSYQLFDSVDDVVAKCMTAYEWFMSQGFKTTPYIHHRGRFAGEELVLPVVGYLLQYVYIRYKGRRKEAKRSLWKVMKAVCQWP